MLVLYSVYFSSVSLTCCRDALVFHIITVITFMLDFARSFYYAPPLLFLSLPLHLILLSLVMQNNLNFPLGFGPFSTEGGQQSISGDSNVRSSTLLTLCRSPLTASS